MIYPLIGVLAGADPAAESLLERVAILTGAILVLAAAAVVGGIVVCAIPRAQRRRPSGEPAAGPRTPVKPAPAPGAGHPVPRSHRASVGGRGKALRRLRARGSRRRSGRVRLLVTA